MVFYGVDAIANVINLKTSSFAFEEVDIKSLEFEFGLSLFIGFAFNTTQKIYLSKEASFDGIYTTKKIKQLLVTLLYLIKQILLRHLEYLPNYQPV